jgi:hypothetical protein
MKKMACREQNEETIATIERPFPREDIGKILGYIAVGRS